MDNDKKRVEKRKAFHSLNTVEKCVLGTDKNMKRLTTKEF